MIALSGDVVREIVTETLFVLDISLFIFISFHLYQEAHAIGFRKIWGRLGNRAAIAFAVHVTGLATLRGWTAFQYWLKDHHYRPPTDDENAAVLLIGLIISVVGMAFVIKIFSPIRWNNWGWILTMMAAAAFIGYMHAK
jgi:hypothetical protein